jgi:predicted transcriptional regulator
MDIMACILEKANSEAKKTHIMYSCNLSFKQFQVYLDFLMENGLIALEKADEGEAEIFRITDEGRSFLDAYRKLKKFLIST